MFKFTFILLCLLSSLNADEFNILVDKYCLECHGGKKTKGGVSFKDFNGQNHIYKNHQIWKDVISQVTEGDMPPEDEKQMTPKEKNFFLSELNKIFSEAEKVEFADPGPSPLRRLTRNEYNNSIRDIFNVNLKLGKGFPSEGGGGEGFDNNAEVSHLSPLMFEKYVQEAIKLSHHLIFTYTEGFNIQKEPVILRNNPQMEVFLKREYASIRNSVYPPGFQVEKYLISYMTTARKLIIAQKTTPMAITAYAQKHKMNPVFLRKFTSYLSDKKSKNELENKILKNWYSLPHNAPENQILQTAKSFYKKYTIARNISGSATSKKDPQQIQFFKNIKHNIFHLSNKEIMESLHTRDREKAISLKKEIDLISDWNERELRSITTKSLGKLSPDKMKHVLRKPQDHLSTKDLKSFNHHQNNIKYLQQEKLKLLQKQIHFLARRAFRRPISKDEISSLVKLFEQERSRAGTQAAARTVAIRIFCSPAFLFRLEKRISSSQAQKISQHELAVRLSYFIWSSTPDEELISAADKGVLTTTYQINTQIERMLKSPKAKALAENFASQWLKFHEILDTIDLDSKKFPEFTKLLAHDMYKECIETFSHIVQTDSSILELIDSPYIFVNESTAKLYGLKGIQGKAFQRVETQNRSRGGIITSPAILAITSYPLRTSPVLRGNWIISSLLGTPTPPPPNDVEELPEDDFVSDGLTVKQRFEKHRENSTCHSCHSRLDPMGFPLEVFDPLGRLRSHSGGYPIDARGELKNGKILDGPAQLKSYLLSKEELFLENLATKALGYALGRSIEFFDRYAIKKAVKNLKKDNYKFSSLIKTIANSRSFLYKRGQRKEQ